MTHMIQNALLMLHAGEWIPVTAARVLIGIFFCISGGTKLFVKARFGVLEQTMVRITHPVPARKCALRRLGRIRLRGRPCAGAAHAAVRRNALGDMIVAIATTRIHSIRASGVPRLARRLPVPARGAIHVDPRLADLLRAGSIQRRWPYRDSPVEPPTQIADI